MRDILKDVYRGAYERPFFRTEEYERDAQEKQRVWDAAEAVLSRRELEELWDTAASLFYNDGYSNFCHGIRLGAAVMRVLLAQQSPTSFFMEDPS